MNQRTSQDVDAPTLCMQMGDDDMEEDGCNGRSLELQDGPKSPLQRELKKKNYKCLIDLFQFCLVHLKQERDGYVKIHHYLYMHIHVILFMQSVSDSLSLLYSISCKKPT